MRFSFFIIGWLTKQSDPQQQAKTYYYDGNSNVVKRTAKERLNEEVRRRERIIRIFPNCESCIPITWSFVDED